MAVTTVEVLDVVDTKNSLLLRLGMKEISNSICLSIIDYRMQYNYERYT